MTAPRAPKTTYRARHSGAAARQRTRASGETDAAKARRVRRPKPPAPKPRHSYRDKAGAGADGTPKMRHGPCTRRRVAVRTTSTPPPQLSAPAGPEVEDSRCNGGAGGPIQDDREPVRAVMADEGAAMPGFAPADAPWPSSASMPGAAGDGRAAPNSSLLCKPVVIRFVLQFLSVDDVPSVSRICRGFGRAVSEPAVLRSFVKQLLGPLDAPAPLSYGAPELRAMLTELSREKKKWDPATKAALRGEFKLSVSVRLRPATEAMAERKAVEQLAKAAKSLDRASHPTTPDRRVRRGRSPREPQGPAFGSYAPPRIARRPSRGGAGGAGQSGDGESKGDDTAEEILKRPSLLHTASTKQVMLVPGLGPRVFNIPSAGESQFEVFRNVALPTVRRLLLGVSGCILAYGQTGSGKTHALFGSPAAIAGDGAAVDEDFGIVPRVCDELFRRIGSDRTSRANVTVQFAEIYNEQAYDLLSGAQLCGVARSGGRRKRGGGFTPVEYSVSAASHNVRSAEECRRLMQAGLASRTQHSTLMNARSSRSHAVFIINVIQEQVGSDNMMSSTLHLVDLAGSERARTSGTTGRQFEEMKAINKSLTFLGRCIGALAARSDHIPYADSLLTCLLQPALGGNCMTSLIVTASSDWRHGAETLSTLRFGERAGTVTSHVSIERESTSGAIMSVRKEIRELQDLMDEMVRRGNGGLPLYERHRTRMHRLTGQLRQLQEFQRSAGKQG